ncbi:MAG: phosphoglucosamine mutase [Candidatus Desulfofervidaceae bacterium]|nr:phosphoglucosamine mutase [Candidatus Desulfofervidaceae bacterium]
MGKLFGTDGVRGKANVWPMTTEIVMQLGRALAYVIKKRSHRHKVVVGKDTRLSGYMIETALTAGICSMGVDVLLIGPLPTPGIAFLTTNMRADAGVVISASHNPYDDNGIKFFGRDGCKLPDETEAEIEKFVLGENNQIDTIRPVATEIGKAFRIDDAIGRYVVFLKNTFPKGMLLDGIKMAIDCAHGAAYRVAPTVFSELGAELSLIGVKPNGENINHNCGALHPEVVAQQVKTSGADIGLALDGDGDRAILVDERGNIVDGDKMLAICADYMKRHDQLKNNTVVGTIMSNFGLELCLKERNIKLLRTQVGDRYVTEALRQGYSNIGGEPSGHIVFLDHHTTGDGILTALQILAIMLREGKPLSELAAIMTPVPQQLLNVQVKEKPPLENIPAVKTAVKKAKDALNGKGRIVLRYSGTEPVARIMVEGTNMNLVEKLAADIAGAIQTSIGS